MAENFDIVDILCSAVVSGAWVAFSVLVVEDTANSGETCVGAVVFRGYQIDTVELSLLFVENLFAYFRVRFLDGSSEFCDEGEGEAFATDLSDHLFIV